MNTNDLHHVAELLDIVTALETLEFHDRNYLSAEMAQPGRCAEEKIRLLNTARSLVGKSIALPPPPPESVFERGGV